MRKLGLIGLMGFLLLFFGMPVNAQEATDSIVSIDSVPEWYVAPEIPLFLRAPMRAAASCPVDSICTFNIDSVLTEVTVYEYGDTTRTMVWTVNANGSRVGKSRTEEATTSTSSYSATYAWDNTVNNWKGTTKTEKTFASGKETVRIIYNSWLNNDWLADTKYTWVYDASGRETEYTTYTRNTSTNQLVLSKQRIREYNSASKTTLDVQYTAHNGTTWSAGTKKIYAFDAAGNQIEYTYYSSLSNGNWVGSTHEVWEYNSAKKKLYYEKQTWSNGNWSNSIKERWEFNTGGKQTLYEKHTGSGATWTGSSKEVWEFDAANRQTLHEKYGWANSNWSLTLQENSGYDAAGNNILVENYNVNNGTFTGSKKEEYTYNAQNRKNNTYTYKWTNGAWVYNQWSVSEYDTAGNATETCKYNWKNDAWVGTGTRTLQTFNSNKKVTEKTIQSWPTNATDWVNKTCTTTVYTGSNITQEAYYTWQNDAWLGTKRSDYHYNAKNQNDTTKTYTNNGTEWIYSNRTVNTFNASGTNIMTHNAKWENDKWVMTSMTRTDISDVVIDGIRQTLNASWRCDADSVWIGLQKDTAAYSATGKNIYNARYISWANNDWVPSFKQTFIYDEADRILLNERYNWSSNQWKGGFRYEYGYDEQGRQNYSATYNSWNTNTGSWVGTSMTETVFNEAGQTLENTLYNWSSNQWTAFNRYLYTYDESGRLKEQIVQNYSNNEWTYSQRFEKGYFKNLLVVSNEYSWRNDMWCITSRSEKTYDDDAETKLRREIAGKWNSSTGAIISYSDEHYSYACDPCLIRFVNHDGTELESITMDKGQTPSYSGATPVREGDAEYSYTFAGWTPEIVKVACSATYTATFTPVKNQYTITWLNDDDSQIDQTTVEYGIMPTHADPTKEATAEFTYTFTGWTPGIGAVTGEASYKATFKASKRSYTITWLNDNDTQIDQTTVEYGEVPTHADATKTNTAEWTYTFKGWDPEIIAVNGNATYKATYTATKNKYLVVFQDEGGTELQSGEVEYGTTPEYSGAQPSKEATAQYTYAFAGWDPEITAVEGAQTYTATYSSTVNKYTIRFINDDDSELQSSEVEYGTTPTYNGETPHKDADVQYTYTFAGWDNEVVAVTGEATYKATYSSTTNQYTVKFVNYDGEELQSSSWNYGAMPSYSGETPTKPADDENNYTFEGWSPVVSVVTKDATYTATYTKAANEYTITWYNDDNTLIDQTIVAYGEVPTHADPTKENNAEWTYTFAGWDHDPVAVIGNASYTATYNATKNKYLVVFQDEGGTELQSGEVEYGETPAFTGAEPSKEATAQYTYAFAGWDPEITAVESAQIYTAKYSSTVNSYTITWLNEDGSELNHETLEYGVTPEHAAPTKENTAEWTYTCTGWTPAIESVKADASYQATFSATKNSYTITWLNEDGSEIEHETLEYGITPSHADIYKESTEEFTYTFIGWTPSIVPVNGDAAYKAVFEATPVDPSSKTFTITFLHDDGITILEQVTVEYGEIPVCRYTPTKMGDAEHYYTFVGWSPEIVPATCNASYTPLFELVARQYVITFKNYDGKVLQTTKVDYGAIPEYTGATPTRNGTTQYAYVFTGWTPELAPVTKEATYKATFERTARIYTVIYYDEDGETELDRVEVAYGQMPHTSVVPTKEEDEEYYYVFIGWTPYVTFVTKDASYSALFQKKNKLEGIEDVESEEQAVKIFKNNILYILRAGKVYTVDGKLVEEY